jgi:hypothetical protein
MDNPLGMVMQVVVRWMHLASVAFLVGGALAVTFGKAEAAALRTLAITAVGGLLISGLYAVSSKTGMSSTWHMGFGIKMLLALHVVAVWFVMTKPGMAVEKRIRLAKGVAFSGLAAMLVAAYLRGVV